MSRRRTKKDNGHVLELKDKYGVIDVFVNPASRKIFAFRWPSRLVGGMVRAWTLGEPPRQPEPWQVGLER